MAALAEQPYKFISEVLSLDEIKDLCAELGVDFANLGGSSTPNSKARELQAYMSRNRRLGDLLEALALYRSDFEPQKYTYMIISDYVDGETAAKLCQELKFDCTKLGLTPNDLKPYDHNNFFRRQKAQLIHEHAQANGRLGDLFQAIKRHYPSLNLNAFDNLLEEAASTIIPDGKPESGDGDGPATISELHYDNFDLRIGEAVNDEYPVEVLYSPKGQVMPVKQKFPLDDIEFQDLVSYMEDLVGEAEDAIELGKKMRQLLFPEDVWSMFRENRTAMKDAGKGLRIRLRIDPPELGSLPWEYCYDRMFDFLAQDRLTPMVRYPAEPLAATELESGYPINILLVTANPEDPALAKLELDKEVKIVHEALAPLVDLGYAKVDVLANATVPAMRKALRDGGYHVLHFLGHGVFENGQGALVLEDGQQGRQTVFASQLRAMLRSSTVKVIYLNACETAAYEDGQDPMTGVALSMVRAGIPAVMAMQFKVPDKTALLFSRELYQSLAQGKPLDLAVTEMRQAAYIDEGDMVYWGIPVLFMRSQDGVIWEPNAEIAAKLAAYEPETKGIARVESLLQTTLAHFESVKAALDPADAGDVLDALTDVQEIIASESPNLDRLNRKIDTMSDILDIYGPSVADPIKPILIEIKQLAAAL